MMRTTHILLLVCILAKASSNTISRHDEDEHLPGPKINAFTLIQRQQLPQSESFDPSSTTNAKVCNSIRGKSKSTDEEDDSADVLKCIKQRAISTGKLLTEKLVSVESELTDLEDFKTFSTLVGDIHLALVKLMETYDDRNQLVYNLNRVSEVFMSFDIKVGSAFLSLVNCTKKLSLTTKTIDHQVGGAFLQAQQFSLDSLAVYSYLPNLYETLGDYKIQSEKTTALNFDPKNVSIAELETKLHISVPHDVSVATLNAVKSTNIFNILNATINHKTEISCSAGHALAMGSFVLLSQVVENSCFNSSNQIEIYAANKLFIDTDITRNGIHIAMASPIWDVQGKRLISIDGAKGEAKDKAMYESRPGYTGHAGAPGNAGAAGGEFFGISQNIFNSKKLTISAKGGNGGDGEKGGDAFHWNGENSMYTPCNVKFNYWSSGRSYDVPDCKAANGGVGGMGGNPGPAGFVKFWDLEGDSNVTMETSPGLKGTGGVGGNAGEVYVHQYYISVSSQSTIDQTYKGSQGASNSNNAGIANPPPPISQIFPSIASIVNFKKTLRKFESVVLESQQQEFLENLENYPTTVALYNTSAPFIEEFQDLEDDYQFKEVNSTSYFASLLKRAENFTCDEAKDDNCQNFRYMRLALMSIVAEGSDEYFVVNVHDYLELLLKNVQQYDTSIRDLNIKQKNEDYISSLLNEIIQAKMFITNDVVTEITKATEGIETEMNELVELVEEHLEDAEALKEELEKKKEQLKKLGALNIFFNVAGFISKAISFIPGAGAIGTILGVGFNAGSSMVAGKIDEIKQSALDAESQIDTAFIAQQKFMEQHLDELYAQINSSQDTTDDEKFVKSEIERFRGALQGTNADFLQAKDQIQKDIDEHVNSNGLKTLGSCTAVAIGQNGTSNENSPVKRLSGIMKAAGDGLKDIYNAVGKNNEAKNELDTAIEATDQEIDALKSYESTIFNALMPMIEDLKLRMLNATNQTDLSHVEIDVEMMKIDNSLNDFKLQMELMVEAFEDPIIKPTIMGCIDKLRSAMKTAMSIFDRMADFRDQAKLINFITDIQLDDSQMSANQIQYEILAKTNMIIKEFDHGVRAFKQFSFPFASLYLDRFQVDQSIVESQNDSKILDAVSDQIVFLTDELVKKATVVGNEGYTIYPEVNFDSTNKSQPPFYVWKNKNHKIEMSLLLQGQQVALSAELAKEETYANALKFKEVGVHFLSANHTIQKKIDKKMDDFQITMTHLGSSYFQCADKKFVINHNKIKMSHAMNRVDDDYGEADSNTVTLRNNPAMCSPYTTWLMRIFHKQGCSECISDLEQFIDEDFDLALEGDGQFIDIPDGKDICGENAEKYYQRVYEE